MLVIRLIGLPALHLLGLRFFKEAAEVAVEIKDADALRTVRSQCKNAGVNAWIDSVLPSMK